MPAKQFEYRRRDILRSPVSCFNWQQWPSFNYTGGLLSQFVRLRVAALSHALINLSRDSLLTSSSESSKKDKMGIQHIPLKPSKIVIPQIFHLSLNSLRTIDRLSLSWAITNYRILATQAARLSKVCQFNVIIGLVQCHYWAWPNSQIGPGSIPRIGLAQSSYWTSRGSKDGLGLAQ